MSFTFWSQSLTDIHQILMATLYDDFDFESAPRGKPIRELIGASFTLENPRDRIIVSPVRNVNYGFAVGELAWYLRGDTDLETMLYYNKRMSQFSDDGKTINSAYGNRMFKSRWQLPALTPGGPEPTVSQFMNVVEELRKDPDSRRAIMHINEPYDLLRAVLGGSKDVPCTLSIQLLIRDRKLHMIVNMRSNDVVWGLPYDVFSFTCLQEAFLYTLQKQGVPVDDLGSYHHHAGSLHLYDTHFDMARLVSEETGCESSPMKPFTQEGLEWLVHQAEPLIRKSVDKYGIEWGTIPQQPGGEDDPAGSIDWMVSQLANHRHKRVEERRQKGLDELVKITEEAGGYPELEQEKK